MCQENNDFFRQISNNVVADHVIFKIINSKSPGEVLLAGIFMEKGVFKLIINNLQQRRGEAKTILDLSGTQISVKFL